MSNKKDFVNLDNARVDEQRKVMEKIKAEGFCPFCKEHISKSELEPEIKTNFNLWSVRKNRWPYENTKIHLLVIHNDHLEKAGQIPKESWVELGEIVKWAEREFTLESGALGMRFGDPKKNGASVDHLHAHILTAQITDKNDPNYKPVRFRAG